MRKVGRRLSARVTDLFKPKAKEASTASSTSTPKVEEAAPQLEEPAPVAPLGETAAVEEVPVVAAVVVEAPPVTPAVAAAA